MSKFFVSFIVFASVCLTTVATLSFSRAPLFPKYKGKRLNNNYEYKELWYPQTVSFFIILFYFVYLYTS